MGGCNILMWLDTISPSEKQRGAALDEETGYDMQTFIQFEHWQPETLQNLRHDLHRIQRGNRIVPIDLKAQVRKALQSSQLKRILTCILQVRYFG